MEMEEAPVTPGLQFEPGVEEYLREYYSSEQLIRLRHALSMPGTMTLRANTTVTTAAELAADVKQHITSLKHERAIQTASAVAPHPVLPDVVVVPPCQGAKPCPLGPGAGEVWVDRFCGEAVLKGAHIFAAGLVGMSESCQAGERVSIYVDVDARLTKGATLAPPVGDGSGIIFIGNGDLVMPRGDVFPASGGGPPRGVAVYVTDTHLFLPSLHGVLLGKMYAQSLPSTVCGHVVDPQPGERVLDMCAAPGGKTTHLATLMRNTGEVVAFDRGAGKVAKIEAAAAELGLTSIKAYANDALKYRRYIADPEEKEGQAHDEVHAAKKLKAGKTTGKLKIIFQRESFDRILTDPPCSALGLRPRLKQDASVKDLKDHANHQRNFLRAAVMLLKVGGTLVFSTCTINPLENEGNVRWLLDTFPLQLVKQHPHLGGIGLPNTGLSNDERKLVQRFDPGVDHGCDTAGFFIAKFTKTDHFF